MKTARSSNRFLIPGTVLAAALAATGCGGGHDDETPVAARPRGCEEMAGLGVAARDIGLPTGGARVTGATRVAASGSGTTAVAAHCRITAEIAPVDPAAPAIKLEVNAPEVWNGKALMYGGGGYNGSILSTAGTIRLQPADVAIPLGRGYVTFASDSGHAGTSSEAAFARNDEALRNYAYEALKKTRDTATALVTLRYGTAPDKLYFHGSSNGGKEALAMIQKYPGDIDGAMIFWPATMLGTAQFQFGAVARAFARPGAYLPIAKRQRVLDAAMAACDALDGVGDGLIGDSRACQTAFDPSTAVLDGRPVRCASGADEGDACLSDAQITALKVMASPIRPNVRLASGETQFPGFNVWGADLGTRSGDAVANTILSQGLATLPPAFPATANMAFLQVFSDQYIRNFVARGDAVSWLDVDPVNPGAYAGRLSALTGLLDMPQTDLSAFMRRGGKIVWLHGTSDQIVPVQASEQYHDRVSRTMGASAVDGFIRFYELPGTSHSGVGSAFTPVWDALGALDTWVTQGRPPVDPVITDTYAVPGRTRPLCRYPQVARYVSGNPDRASSFVCAD